MFKNLCSIRPKDMQVKSKSQSHLLHGLEKLAFKAQAPMY